MTPGRSVVLDVQGAQNPHNYDRGIPRYIAEHTRALLELAPELIDRVLINPSLPVAGNLDWALGRGLLQPGGTVPPAERPRIYHVMSPFELTIPVDELWPVWARRGPVRTVVTVYDLIPLLFLERYLHTSELRARYEARVRLLRQADHLVAISHRTALDTIELVGVSPERVSVIDAGVSERFAQLCPTREEGQRRVRERWPELTAPYVLYVAGVEWRKNMEGLIAAWGRLPARVRAAHRLVITCRLREIDHEHLRHAAAEAGVGEHELLLTGFVPDPDLAALYRGCELFAFASFYEGSGLPILEAMSCGAPVVASATATTPEIFGDDDGTFDPEDPDDIAACLDGVLSDPERLARLRARSGERVRRYTWRRVAEETVRAYDALTARPARRAIRHRPRLLAYTPWPPAQSGVAVYSDRLLTELARRVGVDVVVGGPRVEHEAPRDEVDMRTISGAQAAQQEALRPYEHVLYCMGNSNFHDFVYDALLRRPGVVLAHDVRLTGFYGWYATHRERDDPHWFHNRARAMYGDRLPGTILHPWGLTPEDQAAFGVYMSGEMQRQATRLIVHSHYAADILALDRHREADRGTPIDVVPHAVPASRPRAAPEPDADGPLLVSVGWLDPVKGLDTLVHALGHVLESVPRARLVLAGPAESEAGLDHWRRLGDAVAGGRVEVTGHLEAAEYEALLARADLAVQLRLRSNGEAQGSVIDCLAAGVPVLATALGWVGELPDDLVVKLTPDITPSALAAQIVATLDDPALRERLERRARSYADETSFASVADRYLELLGL